jgi:polar amino acid transport system substrate-binding protein
MLQKSYSELFYRTLDQSLYFITILLLIHSHIALADNGRATSVVLAVEDSWPPYADSEGQGISTNIIKQAFAAIDITLIVRVLPYARVLNDVTKGILVGGYNVTRQESTEKNFLFGQQALLQAPASFYFTQENVAAADYKSITDIPTGSRVGVIIDYEYGDLFDQHKSRFKEVKVSSQEQVIKMLRLGRIDSAIMFDAVASHTLKSMKLSIDSIKQGPLNHTSDIYVAFSRSHKDAQFFADKLDQGLLLIKNNGQYDKLLQY